MKETSRSRNFSPSVVIQKIKKVSCNIMQNIQDSVMPQSPYKLKIHGKKSKDKNDILSEIKGKDSTFNVFLKVSSLLCKVLLIEGKIKGDNINEELAEINFDNKIDDELDIETMRAFLSQYPEKDNKIKNKKGKANAK